MTPRLATFSVFMINGAMIGTWVAHIPWLQDHLGISKATLGLCLLCMAAGALISMPLTGHVLDRRPSADGDPRLGAGLLPDAAAPAARHEPLHARRDPVRVRCRQRGDGRRDERARRGARARAPEADHVLPSRRLEPRRLCRRRNRRDRRDGRGRSARREPGRRSRALAGGTVGDPQVGQCLGSLQDGNGVRAALPCGDPDRRALLPGDDDRGRNRRLERDLPAS